MKVFPETKPPNTELSILPFVLLGLGVGVLFLVATTFPLLLGEIPLAQFLILVGVLTCGVGIFLLSMAHPLSMVHLCLIGGVLDQWEGLDFTGIPFLTLSKILILMSMGCLIVRTWFKPPGGTAILFPAPVLAHIPFSAVCLISTLAFGYSRVHSIRWVIAPLSLPLFAWILVQFIPSREQAIRLTKAFAIYSFFPIGVALLETVQKHRIGGSLDMLYYGSSDIFRVAGNFDNPNDFVVLILFSIPILLLWMLQSPSWWAKCLLAGGTLLQGMILLKTYSRSGYLSLAFVILSLVVLGRGKSRRLALLVCLLGALVAVSLPDVRERLLSLVGYRPSTEGAAQAVASLSYRKMLVAVGWNEFLEHPLLGTGFGNIGFEAKKYSTLLYQSSIENTYLEILAEMGLVGLGFYLIFLFTCGRVLLTGVRNCRAHPDLELFYLALAGGYCGFAFNSLFDTNLVDNIPWVLLPIFLHLGTRPEGNP